MKLRSSYIVLIVLSYMIVVASSAYAQNNKDEFSQVRRGAKNPASFLAGEVNFKDLQASRPGSSDGCGRWDVVGLCIKWNFFRPGPWFKLMNAYFYTNQIHEGSKRPTASMVIPEGIMKALANSTYRQLGSLGNQLSVGQTALYSASSRKYKIPKAGSAGGKKLREVLRAVQQQDNHMGPAEIAGMPGTFSNIVASGSDRLFAYDPMYSNIYSSHTMCHNFHRNAADSAKSRNPNSFKRFWLPYAAIGPTRWMYHYFEQIAQISRFFRERVLTPGEPRNCIGTQQLAQLETVGDGAGGIPGDKPLERFLEHETAGYVNRKSARDQTRCPGSGYAGPYSLTFTNSETSYVAQDFISKTIPYADSLTHREMLIWGGGDKKLTKSMVKNKLYHIQVPKSHTEHLNGVVAGWPMHIRAIMPDPDQVKKHSEHSHAWPKGCRDRWVKKKMIGPQSHTMAPKHNFNTDYIGPSMTFKGEGYQGNHHVVSQWTNVWCCPNGYLPIKWKWDPYSDLYKLS